MRAIVYLNLHLLLNSLRRTFTHPLRVTVTVLIIAWFGFTLLNSLPFSDSTGHTTPPPELITRNKEYLIALLTVIHLLGFALPLSSTTGFRSIQLFTPADVNFLFPSPLHRSMVFFSLLFSRGTISSLFLLLILMITILSAGRDLLASLIRGNPPLHPHFVSAYAVMYLLAFFTVLCSRVLVDLKEEQKEGFRKRLLWTLWGWMAILAGILSWHAHQAWLQRNDPFQAVVWHLLNNPVVALTLLPVRAIAESAAVFVSGWSPSITAGFVFWTVALTGAVYLLIRHQHLFYDFAAGVATHANIYALRRQSPALASYVSAVASAAQQPQKVAHWRVLTRWKPQGAWALVWCHSLLMLRLSLGSQALIGTLIGVGAMIVMVAFAGRDMRPEDKLPFMVIFLYTSTLFTVLFAQSWAVGVLRRVDMNKSLPFPARIVVLTEILPLSLLTYACLTLLWMVMGWLLPTYLWVLACHALINISLVPILFTTVLVLFLFFPDQSDYTQRMLLSFLLFPALLVAALPTILIAAVGALLRLPLWATALCAVGVNAGVLWCISYLAGYQYTRFNLSE